MPWRLLVIAALRWAEATPTAIMAGTGVAACNIPDQGRAGAGAGIAWTWSPSTKTGTLTEGRPELVALGRRTVTPSGAAELGRRRAVRQPSIRWRGAVLQAAAALGLHATAGRRREPSPTRGVIRPVREPPRAALGSQPADTELGADTAALAAPAEPLRAQGRTVSQLADATAAPARLLDLRLQATRSRPAPHRPWPRCATCAPQCATGDNASSAARVAGVLGLDEVRASAAPGQRARRSAPARRRRRGGHGGRRLNDAPALAATWAWPCQRNRRGHARRGRNADARHDPAPGGRTRSTSRGAPTPRSARTCSGPSSTNAVGAGRRRPAQTPWWPARPWRWAA